MLSPGQYSTWNQFLGFSGYFKFLIDVSRYSKSLADISRYFKSLIDASGYLTLVKFSGIIRSVESSRFLKYKVDIGGNFRLSGFPKFWFRVRVVYYKTFLLIIGGGK